MSLFDFHVKSEREEVVEAMKEAREAALEAIGAKVTGFAVLLAPVDTGRLKNSLTWAVQKTEGRLYQYEDDDGNPYEYTIGVGLPDDTVVIGTNVEYAA